MFISLRNHLLVVSGYWLGLATALTVIFVLDIIFISTRVWEKEVELVSHYHAPPQTHTHI